MSPRSASLTRLAAVLLAVGCGGRHGGGSRSADSHSAAPAIPPLTDGATVVEAPRFEPVGCRPGAREDAQPSVPGGARLLDSEEAFQALYLCFDEQGAVVPKSSGVDFTQSVIAVFSSHGQAVAPRLERLERLGDTLTAVFGQTAYCGGAPPPEIATVHAVVVKRERLTLATTHFVYPHEPCPRDLP